MVIAMLIAAAAALWPSRGPLTRVASVTGHGWSRPATLTGGPASARTAVLAGIAVSSAGSLVLFGPAVALAGGALGATGWALWRHIRDARDRRVALEQIVAALRMLARELHAGADPALAAANTVAAAVGQGCVVLAELVRAISDGERPTGAAPPAVSSNRRPRSSARAPAVLASARLGSGWLLTRRYGIAFTPLIDALAAELAEQLLADSRRAAEVAGPRMSGYVMAVLPVLGLLLGAGMGADPVAVLFRTPVGNVLLVVGTALTSAGLLWSARIVSR